MIDSEIRNSQSEIVKRLPEVAVGDIIQYRYSYGPEGFTSWALTTRTVIEVLDGGAAFVVEGFFNVPAKCVTVHIPMHGESELTRQEL